MGACDSTARDVLAALHSALEEIYGDRLRGLYLFGSHARGAATPESDCDVLVVLDRVERYGAEIARTSELVSTLALEHDVSISRVFVDEESWRRSEGPFLETVREDAISA